MTTSSFKLTIHMVASLDGIIAKKDNSVSWFETHAHYEKGVEITEQETKDFLKTIDCYVMGARTTSMRWNFQNRTAGPMEMCQQLW